MGATRPTVYTIGHSNHPLEAFVALLRRHDIAMLADVRSYPASRWVPHFNRKALDAALEAHGIGYRWLGDGLGGKRDDPALLTADGKPDYAKIATLADFRARLDQVAALIAERRVALMCAEEDPMRCHRKHLVGAALSDRGIAVLHIRRDGSVVPDEDLAAPSPKQRTAQLGLFE